MALTNPLLTTPIIPFDSTVSIDVNSNYAHIFKFTVYGGDQVVANRIVIENSDTNLVVYDAKINNFRHEHQLPKNILTNGVTYRVKVQTFNINNQASELSDGVLFKCFTTPNLDIPNIPPVINSNMFDFTGLYSQLEGETIKSYVYYLYDINKALLSNSGNIYNSTLQHRFEGFKDNVQYYVELKVETQNGMKVSSGLKLFSVNYIKPLFAAQLFLENEPDQGSAKINAKILDIQGQIGKEPVIIINGERLDVRNGMVYFNEENGFRIARGDWSRGIYLSDFREDDDFLFEASINGVDLKLVFYNKRFHCFKYLNNIKISHYASNEINLLNNSQDVFVFVQSNKGRIYLQAQIL